MKKLTAMMLLFAPAIYASPVSLSTPVTKLVANVLHQLKLIDEAINVQELSSFKDTSNFDKVADYSCEQIYADLLEFKKLHESNQVLSLTGKAVQFSTKALSKALMFASMYFAVGTKIHESSTSISSVINNPNTKKALASVTLSFLLKQAHKYTAGSLLGSVSKHLDTFFLLFPVYEY